MHCCKVYFIYKESLLRTFFHFPSHPSDIRKSSVRSSSANSNAFSSSIGPLTATFSLLKISNHFFMSLFRGYFSGLILSARGQILSNWKILSLFFFHVDWVFFSTPKSAATSLRGVPCSN